MSSCAGKVRHLSRRSARRARRYTPAEHLRPYWCSICGAWHLGHLPQAVMLGLMSAAEVYGIAQ